MEISELKRKMIKDAGAELKNGEWHYKGYRLADETLDKISSSLLVKCIQFYDGKISEQEFDLEIAEEERIKKAVAQIKELGYRVHPFFIAQIDSRVNEKIYKDISGYDIYFMASLNGECAIINNPIEQERIEEYWKVQFGVLKSFISDDFKEFMECMLSGSDGMISTVPLEYLINFRHVTEDDIDKLEDGIDYIIEKYDLDRKRIFGE